MAITFYSVFNVLMFFIAAYRFWIIYVVLKQIDKRQRRRAFPDIFFPLAGTVLLVLSVLLPVLHGRTFSAESNSLLFFGGAIIMYVPDLILWWKKRSQGAAQ